MNKRENQQAVLAAINNEFALFLDRGGFTILDEYLMPSESIGYDNVENFTEIFQAIKRYIANNRHKFRLGGNSSTENICDGYVEGQRSEDRPHWSPLITSEEEGRGRSQGPHGVCRTRKIMKGNY